MVMNYVDDQLWISPDNALMEDYIGRLKALDYDLTLEPRGDTFGEGTLFGFLGINFNQVGDEIELTQSGLINKVIALTGMDGASSRDTPALEWTAPAVATPQLPQLHSDRTKAVNPSMKNGLTLLQLECCCTFRLTLDLTFNLLSTKCAASPTTPSTPTAKPSSASSATWLAQETVASSSRQILRKVSTPMLMPISVDSMAMKTTKTLCPSDPGLASL